jgi:CelD/BcsL family acetyltransferase involved in cellulose biosynthesis
MLTVRHLRGPEALQEVGEDVDGLAAALQLPVTARRRWLQSWIDTTPAWRPWVVVVTDDSGTLQAVAPLSVRRRAGVLEVVLAGHGPTDDARLPARTPEAADALARAIAGALPSRAPWRLRFSQLPESDPVVAALRQVLPRTEQVPGQGMPIAEVHGSNPDQHLSKNVRKALAKIRNRLRDRGLEPEFAWTTDAEGVGALLPELMRVHRERDLALGRRADHDDPAAAAFYREVLARHARAGELAVFTLRFDGDLAAYLVAFRDGRVLRIWDSRLAPRWADLSAGRVANTEVLRHVVRSDEYDALDWMRGEEPYKLQSATRVVPTVGLHAWSSAPVQKADQWSAAAVTAVRDRLRSSTAIRDAVHRVRRLRAARPGS